ASARSSLFLFRCSRWTRASSLSRHRLVVNAIPTAAQAITALVRQCKATHEKPRVREFIIWNNADCGREGTEYRVQCAARRLQKSHAISRVKEESGGTSLWHWKPSERIQVQGSFSKAHFVLSRKKAEHFKQLLETR